MKYKIVAVDFDDTLVRFNRDTYPFVADEDVNMLAMLTLKEYKDSGGKLILFTARTDQALTIAINTCKNYGVVFDMVNADLQESIDKWRNEYPNSSISPKPIFDMLIDDRAYPCCRNGLDWNNIRQELLMKN